MLLNNPMTTMSTLCYAATAHDSTQSRIIGAVRGAHSQLWGTIIPVCSPCDPRKYDKRFGTLQLSDLQGEIKPIRRTSDLQGERMLICRTYWLFFLLKGFQ